STLVAGRPSRHARKKASSDSPSSRASLPRNRATTCSTPTTCRAGIPVELRSAAPTSSGSARQARSGSGRRTPAPRDRAFQLALASGVVNESRLPVAAVGLVVGGVLGMAGTFAPSASWRGLAWGLDGTALVVATALLAVHHVRRGNDVVAAGFLVFLAGETLILSTASVDLAASAPSFGAGVALWAA